MASEYDQLTGQATFATLGERWLGNVLGANAWGSSLIVGDGTVYPRLPLPPGREPGGLPGRDAARARGGRRRGTERRSELWRSVEACGPARPSGVDEFPRFDNAAVFADNEQSYTTVEPAIDLTASSMLAFAWQIAPPRPLGG